MAELFNISETLAMACEIERNGARYYRRAAELVDAPEAVGMLRELAEMEDDHESAFSAMQNNLDAAAVSGELSAEGVHYLRAFTAGHIFPVGADPAADITAGISLEQVLRQAIGMEKDSIVFYLGIRDAMPAHLGQEKVDMIIREEMRHVTVLSDRLSQMASGR